MPWTVATDLREVSGETSAKEAEVESSRENATNILYLSVQGGPYSIDTGVMQSVSAAPIVLTQSQLGCVGRSLSSSSHPGRKNLRSFGVRSVTFTATCMNSI